MNLTHLLHNFSPEALRSSTLRRVSERGTLWIGYLSARPWIHRSAAGLHGHDASAAMRLAQVLKVQVWFVECRAGDLATLLARGEIDLALGGLVDYGWEEVCCVPARHLIGAPVGERSRGLRQVFFPNTWWLCRGDRLWCWRVRTFLWAHRSRALRLRKLKQMAWCDRSFLSSRSAEAASPRTRRLRSPSASMRAAGKHDASAWADSTE
ncbi:MAG TPA: hypothetical protein VEY92_08010 [Pseudoxanthomonas sp.]|nr:hypothetical protein [Pseudoxanthomonas sp.]